MIEFTTSKGEFIAVPVPENQGDDFDIIRDQDKYSQQQLQYPSDKYNGLQNYSYVNLPEGEWEIIGLSSDILKDEELAKKVVWSTLIDAPYDGAYGDVFRATLFLHNITGNNLIIKKK